MPLHNHPTSRNFKSLSAFRAIYSGAQGHTHALNDVYGPRGAQSFLRDERARSLDREFGVATASPYNITADHFISLYEQMTEKERLTFKGALDDFIEQIAYAPVLAGQASLDLAKLRVATDFGRDAAESDAGRRMIIELEQSMLEQFEEINKSNVLRGVPFN